MERKACAECKHNCKEDFKGVCLKCLNDGGKEFEDKPADAVRLIDANSITEAMVVKYLGPGYASCAPDVLDLIRDMHTIEAEPVVHAHWERGEFVADPNGHEMNGCLDGYWCRRCSHCHGGYTCPHRYCPNCGAHMDEGV